MPDKGLHVQQNENVDRGRLQVNVTSTLGLQPVVNARVGIAYTGESQRLLEDCRQIHQVRRRLWRWTHRR